MNIHSVAGPAVAAPRLSGRHPIEAHAERTANPVAQMGTPEVFERFTARELEAIPWDGLEEDIARCADYDLMPPPRRHPRRRGLGYLGRSPSSVTRVITLRWPAKSPTA